MFYRKYWNDLFIIIEHIYVPPLFEENYSLGKKGVTVTFILNLIKNKSHLKVTQPESKMADVHHFGTLGPFCSIPVTHNSTL